MSVTDTKLNVLFLILFFSISTVVQATNWYQLSENNNLSQFNAVAGDEGGLHRLFAVGDNGTHFVSENDGLDWLEENTGVSENLHGITVVPDWSHEYLQTYEFAVGDNGRVLKSLSHSGVWESMDTLGSGNYNFAEYIWKYGEVLIGGQNSQCYHSYDLGLHWTKVYLPAEDFNIVGVREDSYDVYLFAERNDTTFILTSDEGLYGFHIAPGDTLPNTKFVASAIAQGEASTPLYVLMTNRTTGSSQIYVHFNGSNETLHLVYEGDLGTPSDMNIYLKDNQEEFVLWLTNLEGTIWESHNTGSDWFIGYQDPQARQIYHILTSSHGHDHGRAFGSGGLVLKYGFELRSIEPGPNSNLGSDFSRIELHFSLVPNLDSLESGIHIQSLQNGTIPYEMEQDPGDFKTIYLNLPSGNYPLQIPGDRWNVSFSDKLRAESDTLNELFDSFNFSFQIVSQQATSFNFNNRYQSNYLGSITTNWATGLINQDDKPDLVTFTRDTLFCFTALDSGGYLLNKVGLSLGVQLDINIKNQLILSDVNRDGLPDVILYDFQFIRIYLNQSTDTAVNFVGPTAEKMQRDLRQVVAYNANNNDKVDLLIVAASSFYTEFDITGNDFGNYQQDALYSGAPPLVAAVADLDNDTQQDLAVITTDQILEIYHGQGFGTFDDNRIFRSVEAGYTTIRIADLNDDQLPEILAAKTNSIDMYGLYSPGYWDFMENSAMGLVDLGQQPIADFCVQDFGGQRMDEKKAQMDILVLSPDSLRIYQNNSNSGTQPLLERLPHWAITNHSGYNQILLSDFNRDNALDFATCAFSYGNFSVWGKLTWKPSIENIWYADDAIHLDWTPSPADMGTLAYYRVYRDNKPEISQFSFVRTTNDTHFDDYEYNPFDSLFYAVQAVYTDGSESELSDPVYINSFIELDGAVSGVLSDTTREYLVPNGIWVPSGSSLEISKGVSIGFREHAYFAVYGALNVQGEWEDEMVDFYSADSLSWAGLRIAPAADTVHFNWFSISGADTALAIDDRPFEAKLGGIMGNKLGIIAREDSLSLENIIFDSNMVAVEINTGQQALLKNVNIFHSQINSVTVKGDSRTHIRNSIIWDNNGQIQKSDGTPDIYVRYSTVDHMQQSINNFAISQLPPIFMPPDSGFYRPAYMSPTIDAGDPADAYMDEPTPNGNQVNQGLFGGTFLATPSFQPRIEPRKENIFLAARLGNSDTSGVWIKNKGFTTLHLSEIFLLGESNIFQISGTPASVIEPGDSARINIVFNPPAQGDFNDTLRIIADDPHLIDNIKDISVFGRCTLLTPVVKLQPLFKTKQKQSALRFRYVVVDSGEGVSGINPSDPNSYQLYTSLVRKENSDTMEAFRQDRNHVDYVDLPDGTYLFKIWAVPIPGEPGEQNVKSQEFTVSAEERDAFRNRWYMLSIPTNMDVNWEDFALGDSSAYLLKWNNEEEQYDEVESQHIPAGQAFWAFTLKKVHLDLKMLETGGNSIKLAGENSIPLVTGWNQIGIPERFNMFWDGMQIEPQASGTVLNFSEAVHSGLLDGAVYYYEHTIDFQGYRMDVVDSMAMAEPWRGYWLYANQPGTLYFPEEPAFPGDSTNTAIIIGPESGLAKSSDTNWKLNISLKNEDYWDTQNIIGINSDNSVTIHEPPHMGDFCALYMPSDKGNMAQLLKDPFKNDHEVKTWDMQIATRAVGKPHTLSWNTKMLPQNDVYLYLVDDQNEAIINMFKEKSYTFHPHNGKNNFKIYASKDETFRPQIVPSNFVLKQNYPNPFNPETTIRFGVPASAQKALTTLTVYNVLGEKVAVIFSGNLKMGFHEFKWNGKNMSGKNVASGVYFYKLNSGKTSILRKMVLVR